MQPLNGMRLELSINDAQALKQELDLRLKELSQEFIHTEKREFRRELKIYIERLENLSRQIESQIDLETMKYAI